MADGKVARKQSHMSENTLSPIFVVLQPNLQDMLTIAQSTCTLHRVLLSALLFLLACFQGGIMKIIYAKLFIFQGVFEGKTGFRKVK